MKRIKYISRFARPLAEADVEAIVRQAVTNNRRDQVTGILMASGDLFFQIVEGPDAAVDALFAKILADPRHRDVLTLRVEQGEKLSRLFPGWQMGKFDLGAASGARTEPLKAILAAVHRQGAILEDLTAALERAAHIELSDAGRATSPPKKKAPVSRPRG